MNAHAEKAILKNRNGYRKTMPNWKKLDRKIKQANKNFRLVKSTYRGFKYYAQFFDVKFGYFWARVADVYFGKIRHHPKDSNIRVKTAKEVEQLVQLKNPNVSLIYKTYKGSKILCKWFEKGYGYFWSVPNYMTAKKNETVGHPKSMGLRITKVKERNLLNKYGVTNVMQIPEIAFKSQHNGLYITVLKHWKTGKKLFCKGSYEVRVVSFLNFNKIDFNWQIPIKLLNSKRLYICDLYLPDSDVYIEIKGCWRGPSRSKWLEFKHKFPNSVLWSTKVLKQLGIL